MKRELVDWIEIWFFKGLKTMNNRSGRSAKWTGRSSGHCKIVLYNRPDHLTEVVSHETIYKD